MPEYEDTTREEAGDKSSSSAYIASVHSIKLQKATQNYRQGSHSVQTQTFHPAAWLTPPCIFLYQGTFVLASMELGIQQVIYLFSFSPVKQEAIF